MLGTNVEIFNSDDYATMVSGNLYFYYGYEETNPTKKINDKFIDDEWCFVVKKNNIKIFEITQTQIEKEYKNYIFYDVKDYLLAGIGIFLCCNGYKL